MSAGHNSTRLGYWHQLSSFSTKQHWSKFFFSLTSRPLSRSNVPWKFWWHMLYFQAAESLFRSSNSIWAQRGLPMNWEPFAFQLAYLYSSSTTSEHNYSAIPRISLRKSLEFLAGSVLMATNDWPSFASLFWVSASWICLNFTNILNGFISGKWKWNSEICACLHLSVVYIFRKLANYRSRAFCKLFLIGQNK